MRVDSLPVDGRAARLAPGSLLRTGPGEVGGGRADDEPLVRRPRDAASLRRSATARSPTRTASSRRKAYRAARDKGEITYSEFATDPCRSLFKRVAAMFIAEALRQRERQPGQARRALHRDDRDADPGPVRRRDARDRRRRLRRARAMLTTAHPHLDRADRRHAQLRRQARAAQRVPLLPPRPRRARAAR